MIPCKLIYTIFFSFFISSFSYGKRVPVKIPPDRKSAVIAEYSGGRFGDNLIAWAHGYYFAKKNDYDFYVHPFQYSDQLALDTLPKYTSDIACEFRREEVFKGGQVPCSEKKDSTLFIIPYFPETEIELGQDNWFSFKVDWEDKAFKQELRELIKPKNPLMLIEPPKGIISVAVHIRKGGSHSNEEELSNDPIRLARGNLIYKIPLDGYYINQIKKSF